MKSMSLREALRVLEILFIRVYTQFSEKKILIINLMYIWLYPQGISYLPTSRPFFSANNIA
jgi:hypothetical protein